MKRLHTIRASEIGVFLYCQRAWWYQRQGFESQNQAELETGSILHQEHSRRVLTAGLLRIVALILLLATLVLLSIYITQSII